MSNSQPGTSNGNVQRRRLVSSSSLAPTGATSTTDSMPTTPRDDDLRDIPARSSSSHTQPLLEYLETDHTCVTGASVDIVVMRYSRCVKRFQVLCCGGGAIPTLSPLSKSHESVSGGACRDKCNIIEYGNMDCDVEDVSVMKRNSAAAASVLKGVYNSITKIASFLTLLDIILISIGILLQLPAFSGSNISVVGGGLVGGSSSPGAVGVAKGVSTVAVNSQESGVIIVGYDSFGGIIAESARLYTIHRFLSQTVPCFSVGVLARVVALGLHTIEGIFGYNSFVKLSFYNEFTTILRQHERESDQKHEDICVTARVIERSEHFRSDVIEKSIVRSGVTGPASPCYYRNTSTESNDINNVTQTNSFPSIPSDFHSHLFQTISQPGVFWPIVFAIFIILKILYSTTCVAVEEALVIEGHGILLTTRNHLGLIRASKFLNISLIRALVIHEGYYRQHVVYYLAAVMENQPQMEVLFDTTLPRLCALRKLLVGMRAVLYREPEIDGGLQSLADMESSVSTGA